MKVISRSATAAGFALLMLSTVATAQPAPASPSAPSVVLQPLISSPMPVRREPAFVAPPPVRDEPETPWRAANDEAARLGGHVGQLRGRR